MAIALAVPVCLVHLHFHSPFENIKFKLSQNWTSESHFDDDDCRAYIHWRGIEISAWSVIWIPGLPQLLWWKCKWNALIMGYISSYEHCYCLFVNFFYCGIIFRFDSLRMWWSEVFITSICILPILFYSAIANNKEKEATLNWIWSEFTKPIKTPLFGLITRCYPMWLKWTIKVIAQNWNGDSARVMNPVLTLVICHEYSN
jgi:hypothetical protein